jgi:hypothetical protein
MYSSIPEDATIESRFRPVTDTVPEFLPITDTERDTVGNAMGLPVQDWDKLIKRPVLTLPQTPLATRWMRWASSNRNLPRGAGFIMMHPNNYNEQAMLSNRPHTAQHQDISLRAFGKPMVFWQFIVAVDDETPEERVDL